MVKVILVALAVIVFMAVSAVIGFFGGGIATYTILEKYMKKSEEFEAYDQENCEHREIGFLASWRNEPTLK